MIRKTGHIDAVLRHRVRADTPCRSTRRKLLFALGAGAFTAPLALLAQQRTRIPRIGWLQLHADSESRHAAFLQGLRELGYIEGQNLVIERRAAGSKEDRLATLAAELIRLRVDVLVALEPPAVIAAKNSTTTIPIVMRSTDDPVEGEWVASLARPGGNITGVTSYSTALIGKRMELLREMLPHLSRVAVLWDPDGPVAAPNFHKITAAARALGVQVQSLETRSAMDFETAFNAAVKARAGALFPLRSPLIVEERKHIAGLALKRKLPAIYDDREFVEAGGLMSYGTNLADSYRRAASYVDKILKGAKPADLPVEQPTRFELVINMKTAKALGLTIPQTILVRADKVID